MIYELDLKIKEIIPRTYNGVIKDITISLSRKKYLEIEDKMRRFSKKINIPMSHLDLVLWYKETGEIFK